eukprot:9064493-Pyramimonas_sp.AAC.1
MVCGDINIEVRRVIEIHVEIDRANDIDVDSGIGSDVGREVDSCIDSHMDCDIVSQIDRVIHFAVLIVRSILRYM